MTVAAWDGKYLAVDSRVTIDRLVVSDNYKKMHRITDPKLGPMVVALSGTTSSFGKWIEALESTGLKQQYGHGENSALAITTTGRAFELISEHGWWEELDYPTAIGSGYTLAIPALKDGATAVEAVRYAIRHNTGCGGTIRVYDHEHNLIWKMKS